MNRKMSRIRERYNEDAKHEAACTIAIACRRLPSNHPIVRLIAQGRNDEALQLLDGMDFIENHA